MERNAAGRARETWPTSGELRPRSFHFVGAWE